MRWKTMTLVAAVVVSCSSATALGQDKGWFTDSAHGSRFYDIRFPGGTAAEYYKELGLESHGNLNVIVQDGADLVMLPPIQVRNVSRMDLVQLPQKLHDGLYIEGSDNLAAARGGPIEEVGAFTIVVKVDPAHLHRLESQFVQIAGERRFDLRFGGGTAVEYVEAIREAYSNANILAMPGLEEFVVPAVNLDGVTVDAALESIEGQEAMIDGAWAKVRLSDADIEGREERVFTISLERRESKLESRVWSVGEQLELGVDEADLLSAVQAVLTLNDQVATVRFHPETRLLMVRGHHQTLEMVQETISQIQRSAWTSQNPTQSETDAVVRELRNRIDEMERDHQLEKDRLLRQMEMQVQEGQRMRELERLYADRFEQELQDALKKQGASSGDN